MTLRLVLCELGTTQAYGSVSRKMQTSSALGLSRQKKKAKNLTKEQAVVLAKDDYCLVFGACFRR